MTIQSFPHFNLKNIPESLRLLANKIETGEIEAARAVVLIELDGDGAGVHYKVFGKEPFPVIHAIGIVQAGAEELMSVYRNHRDNYGRGESNN